MQVQSQAGTFTDLLAHNHKVGKIVRMDYGHATIVSDDYDIQEAGGIPKNCFLLAAPIDRNGLAPTEAILLKVTGIAELDLSRDLRALREQLASNDSVARLDPTTTNRMQKAGYDCRIVGTFYDDGGTLVFGNDIDRVLSAQSYEVLKPIGKSLSVIASYSRKNTLISSEAKMVELGRVRYTETEKNVDENAKIFVDVRDFIGKKTALLGMSRTGKALSQDTNFPVPVSSKFPTGWAKNHQLEIGDELYGVDGKITKITNFTPWSKEKSYIVTFSDGQTVTTSAGHLWSVIDSYEENRQNNKNYISKRERKTAELNRLDKIIESFDNTLYLKLGEISSLSGISEQRLLNAAKEAGIERHLGVTMKLDNTPSKTTKVRDNLYPIVELIQAVKSRHARRGIPKSRLEMPPITSLRTTEEMFNNPHSNCSKSRWRLPMANGIECDSQSHSIDPYLLGYWLGDGTSAQAYFTVSNDANPWEENDLATDKENFIAQVEQAGKTVKTYERFPLRVFVVGMSTELRKLNLLKNKHIPMSYLRSSYEDRIALLQGLMDSDGTVSKKNGRVYFSNSNENLAKQFLELVRSLGVKATIKEKVGSYRKNDGTVVKCKISYTISFLADFEVFRLPRKLKRQKKNLYRESYNRITSIEIADPQNFRCVTVDAKDSLHLVEGFLPTHNSNTIKTLAQQIFEYSRENNEKIGQLIFDPQGEYANDNAQDMGSSLAALGNGHDVVIYRTAMKGVAYEKQLLLNLLEEENLQLLWDLMLTELENGISAKANYISGLRTIEFIKPDKAQKNDSEQNYYQLQKHYERKRLALYAFLKVARYKGAVKNLYINIGQENVEVAVSLHDDITFSPTSSRDGGVVNVRSVDASYKLFKWILEQEKSTSVEEESDGEMPMGEGEGAVRTILTKSWLDDLEDGDLAEFKKQFEMFEKGRTGVVSAFDRLRELHSADSQGDVSENIWKDLKAGKLVIVDLSTGSPDVITTLSELIVTNLVKNSSELFTSGQPLVPYQIILEEAHNLFSRTGQNTDTMSPWVRLSKEGAKYQIGLVYGTQEITGVDQSILSNTANFICTHLNSQVEVRELSKYYSFGEWAEQIIASESRGFARVKTESSPFIIPVQIAKFDPTSGKGE